MKVVLSSGYESAIQRGLRGVGQDSEHFFIGNDSENWRRDKQSDGSGLGQTAGVTIYM